MMMAIENPVLNLENLSFLKKKIDLNDAGQEEFEKLQFFLNLIGVDTGLLMKELKYNGINSFEEYKLLSQKDPKQKNVRAFKSYALGTMIALQSKIK